MKVAIFSLVAWILEPVISIFGMCSEMFREGYRYEIERRLRGGVYFLFYKTTGLKIDRGVQLEGLANIQLKKNVKLYSFVNLIAGPSGRVVIGEGTHIGRMSVINGLGGAVYIGDRCSISSHVLIFSITNTTDEGVAKGNVRIGNSVFIGAGVTILPSVSIGDHACIGAGAVVLHDVPPGEVVGGVPAKRL